MLLEAIRELALSKGMTFTQDKEVFTMERVVAERKTFLFRQRLLYRARFRLVEEKREIHFTELLKEEGWGLSFGSTGSDLGPGLGFRKETLKSGFGPREGRIEEQISLFSRKYGYTLDFGAFRREVEAAAQTAGYLFCWRLFL